jgi:hypothetical protein
LRCAPLDFCAASARPVARVRLLGAVALPSLASAVTFIQTSDECTGGCAINAGNFINVTSVSANVTDFTVTLATGWKFVNTGANGTGGILVSLAHLH